MLVTTTTTVEGRPVSEYLRVVSGETILGANVFRDIGAMFKDLTGGRVGGYEKELRKARDQAIEEMIEEARAAGAEGVLGVDLDYETINGSMLMVTASGTAVRFSQ